MTPHLLRAQQLMAVHRFDMAADALRRHLLEAPDDGSAHAILSICLCSLDELQAATEHAQQAIGLEPEVPLSHLALAHVLKKRNCFPEALAAIEEAIRLDPQDADAYGIRADLHIGASRWQAALDSADIGLEIEPDNDACVNARAIALVRLGRRDEAAHSLGAALARDPDNALTHANQGWALLERGNPTQAMQHFGEALRLDPDLAWARSGIIEAMKARSLLYRLFLKYLFWMARWPRHVQWGIVAGGLFGQRILRGLSQQWPVAAPVFDTLFWVYVAFALATWLAYHLFNLLLFTSRFGRLAMTPEQRAGALVLAGVLGLSAGLLTTALFTDDDLLFYTSIRTCLLSIPAVSIFACPAGWPRRTIAGATLLLALLIVVSYVGTVPVGNGEFVIIDGADSAMRLFPMGLLGSQFLAIYLGNVRVRR